MIKESLERPVHKVVAYYGMGMKSVLFQAEEEYRVICKAEGDVEYRCGRDMLIPFIKVPIRKQEEGTDTKAGTCSIK
ncbi:MAG: hypothetical protein ACLR6B_14765 [Blautia sp.]